jgi:2-C-methyl-D-erythritol 2,4-cyclodiphosphate synthase
LLRRVCAALAAAGWRVQSLDCTLLAQAPRLATHFPRMVENIAADLGIAPSQVNVKATTTEGLGFIGREEGIAAHAVALVVKAENR